MSTSKKASVKAVEYCSKLTGKDLPKSTSWEEVADILMEGFEWDIQTRTADQGNCTVVRLYQTVDQKGERDKLLETWTIPNSEVFYEKDGDWDWPYLYKLVSEYLMANHKRIKSGKPLIKKPLKMATKTFPVRPSNSVDIKALRALKVSLYHKARYYRLKGETNKELEDRLAEVNRQLEAAKK